MQPGVRGNNDRHAGAAGDHDGHNAAVSELIGAIVLTAVIVAGVTIVGVVLWSQPPPQKIPHVSAIISNKSCTVYLYHNGGDVLIRQQFQILIDGTNQTANFTMIGGANPWTSWGNGDTLQYTPATCAQLPRRADIIFNDGTVNAVISTVFFGAGLPTPTPAPTPIPAPVADFSGTPLSGTAPLSVAFTDTSSNTPTSWTWEYRNATTGWTVFNTTQNATFSFAAAGIYSINLTATNAGGSGNLTRDTYITVTIPPPVAGFTGTPLSGTAPLSVIFTDTSSNTPASWAWGAKNLTPGNNTWFQFSTNQNPVQVFGVGNWSINLTATNAAGSNISTQITWVNITPLPPVAGFTGTPLSGIAPLLVTFTDTSSNTPTSWRWSFKNTTTGWTVFSTTQNPTFSFPKGRYDINLTATNAGGSNTLTRNNYITTYTIVSFTASTTWTVPSGVTSVEYLVVAGGGGGAGSRTFANKGGGGGGGAGGFITGTLAVTPSASLTVTIGAGGAGGAAGNNRGIKGGNSSFANTTAGDGINAMGGGYGAVGAAATAGGAGGSGGGGYLGGAGGAGISGQGYNGGAGLASPYLAGGGGGSGQAGSDATGSAAGKGGDGTASSISGSSVTYAGGGGGGSGTAGIAGAAGGSGGGGAGGALNVNNGAAATGYGSGGGGGTSAITGGANRAGGNGSNGIVIIMYQDP